MRSEICGLIDSADVRRIPVNEQLP
jgi:hypothetical protein